MRQVGGWVGKANGCIMLEMWVQSFDIWAIGLLLPNNFQHHCLFDLSNQQNSQSNFHRPSAFSATNTFETM